MLAALVTRQAVGPALAMPTVANVLRERAGSGPGLAVLANLGERLFAFSRIAAASWLLWTHAVSRSRNTLKNLHHASTRHAAWTEKPTRSA